MSGSCRAFVVEKETRYVAILLLNLYEKTWLPLLQHIISGYLSPKLCTVALSLTQYQRRLYVQSRSSMALYVPIFLCRVGHSYLSCRRFNEGAQSQAHWVKFSFGSDSLSCSVSAQWLWLATHWSVPDWLLRIYPGYLLSTQSTLSPYLKERLRHSTVYLATYFFDGPNF
jgi:hypothetical protein